MTIHAVLLSGGIDSTTVLKIAERNHQKDIANGILLGRLLAYTSIYGQRHESRELKASQQVCQTVPLMWDQKIFDLRPIIGIGGLTNFMQHIPNVSYDDLPKGPSPSYVPFRNGLMLSVIASQVAAVCNEINTEGIIYVGTHQEDAARDAYPDCSLEFIGAMAAALQIGTYGKVRLQAPLISMVKADIIKLGAELSAPYELTWSCYAGMEKQCGICPTCRARRQGFIEAGIADPTSYMHEVEGAA